MARLIRLDATGPVKIDPASIPAGKMIFVCACGLSKTFPLCDGTHKAKCAAEQPGMLYTYDPVSKEVTDCRPDAPAAGPARGSGTDAI
jgi:CDGSH-type Zn-finger protein